MKSHLNLNISNFLLIKILFFMTIVFQVNYLKKKLKKLLIIII